LLDARLRPHDRRGLTGGRVSTLDRRLPLGLTPLTRTRLFAHFAAGVVLLECVALIHILARTSNHLVTAAAIRRILRRAALQRLHRRTLHVIAHAPIGFAAHALNAFRFPVLVLRTLHVAARLTQRDALLRCDIPLGALRAPDLLRGHPRGTEIATTHALPIL